MSRTRIAITAAAALGAGLLPPFALSQEQDEINLTVKVTGTRIQRQDYVSNSPLTTVSSQAIRATGALSTEAVLNALPQVVPGLSATSNNPSNGTATVNLRGLGSMRTLVLINGKRLNPSVNDGTVDLNNVPTRLIERVEVTTGGASAVYGSDALGGVVNFIIRDDFNGMDIGAQYGQSAHGDGADRQVDLLIGGNFADGTGNLTAFGSWYKRDSIEQAARDYTRVDFLGGSATGISGRFDNAPGNPFDVPGSYSFAQDGSVRPFVDAMPENGVPEGDRYNFAPPNYLLTPAERFSIGAFGHYDFSENHQVYSDLFYVDSRNAAQLAPTPATGILVDATSPLLSSSAESLLSGRENDATAPAILRRRMIEIGARQQQNSSKLQQLDFGFRGILGARDLRYDAYFSYGRTEFTNFTSNDVSRSRLTAGVNGCPPDYIRFVPTCVSVDVFGAGNVTKEAADFVRLNFTDVLTFERTSFSAAVNGTLMRMPAGESSFAVGAEWRQDSSDFNPDQSKRNGDVLGFNSAQPISGEFDVTEVFAEAIVPLVSRTRAAKDISLELGVRLSEYSTVGGIATYKAGINWLVQDSFRVRGMYQSATRAPSVFELFQAGDQGFPPYTDPCARLTQTSNPSRYAFCQLQGIAAPETFIQSNAQIEAFFFGNPDLEEESSDTITFGFVAQPSFARGLQFSLDYWDITVDQYINPLLGGAQGVIDSCFDSLDLDSAQCFSDRLQQPLISRDEAGELKVRVPLVNTSRLETSGIDLQVDYPIPLRWAGLGDSQLDMNLLVTYLNEYVLDDIDYAGTIGAFNIPGAFPELKANLRLSYGIGALDLALNTRYIDAMDNQGNIPAFEAGSSFVGSGGTVYFDVNARWQATRAVELSAGILNLADRRPPVISHAIDQNSDPSTYDMIGRFWYGGVRVKF